MEFLNSKNVCALFWFVINFCNTANIQNQHSWFITWKILRSEFSNEKAWEINKLAQLVAMTIAALYIVGYNVHHRRTVSV